MKISVFFPSNSAEIVKQNKAEFEVSSLVKNIFVLGEDIATKQFFSSETLRCIAAAADAEYVLFYSKPAPLKLGKFALERMVQVADDAQAGMLYADYYKTTDGKTLANPLIDCQLGSVRDDFDFGSLLFFSTRYCTV